MDEPSSKDTVCTKEVKGWHVAIVDADAFSESLGELYALYERSFLLQPERRGAIEERFNRHMKRNRFTACLVRDGAGCLAGFSYGFLGSPGEWWHDRIRGQLDADKAMEWMADSFEMAEVAVDPQFQGRGVGAILVGDLRRTTSARTVLLTVRTDNENAKKLYRRMGFEVVIESLYFPGDSNPYAVMGSRA